MQRPYDRLAAGLRAAVAALVWLTPAALLALVLEASLGGAWLVYLALLLAGVGIGVWLERARAETQAGQPPRPAGSAGPSGGPPASEGEDDHSSQKYLM